MIISWEAYEATWVAMSVSVSLFIGFVAFVVLMNDKGEAASQETESEAANGRKDKQ